MPRAILIAGAAPEFLRNTRELEDFLRTKAHIKDVVFLEAVAFSEAQLEERLTYEVEKSVFDDPILITYCGHGGDGLWMINQNHAFAYQRLVRIVSKSTNYIFFVDDCCLSASLNKVFSDNNISRGQVGVIASCGIDQYSSYNESLVSSLICHWTKSSGDIMVKVSYSLKFDKPFSQKAIRWGAEFDSHFYARKSLPSNITPP